MNKAEKVVLSLGLLLWVVGDWGTTAIGINYGLQETNPITSDLFEIAILKIGVIGIILIFIDLVEKKNLGFLKIPIYTQLIVVGGWYTIHNAYLIYGVI